MRGDHPGTLDPSLSSDKCLYEGHVQAEGHASGTGREVCVDGWSRGETHKYLDLGLHQWAPLIPGCRAWGCLQGVSVLRPWEGSSTCRVFSPPSNSTLSYTISHFGEQSTQRKSALVSRVEGALCYPAESQVTTVTEAMKPLYSTLHLFCGLTYSTHTFDLLSSTFLVLHSMSVSIPFPFPYDIRMVSVATTWPVLEVRIPEVTCLSRMFCHKCGGILDHSVSFNFHSWLFPRYSFKQKYGRSLNFWVPGLCFTAGADTTYQPDAPAN